MSICRNMQIYQYRYKIKDTRLKIQDYKISLPPPPLRLLKH